MAKKTNQVGFKGILDVNFEEGRSTITEVTKETEYVYDFFKELANFNGKSVTISIKEDNEITPIED